jgi:type VI secretion system protein ImpK
MRNELAERVYPVFPYAFALSQRLRQGEQPSLGVEQSVFLGLLGVGSEDRVLMDYDDDRAVAFSTGPAANDQTSAVFLGARYALVCWLDELFVLDAPWSEQWNEHKLEVSLYASNDRAWRFWNQAKLAASRGLVDVLEVYYLCAMLGFRGEMRDQPEKLREWFEVAGQQIRHAQSRRWDSPLALLPLDRVPVLRGRRDLRVLLTAASLSVFLLIPVVILLLLRAAG